MKTTLVYIVMIVILITVFGLTLMSQLFVKWPWLCKYLELHRPPLKKEFDGECIHGVCPVCGKNIFKGSQGGWTLWNNKKIH